MKRRLAITGGRIYPGFGLDGIEATLLVEDSRIAAITSPEVPLDVESVLDARGCVVVPGFIDAHVHAEKILHDERTAAALLTQGITSVVLGQDGCSSAPGSTATIRYMSRYFSAVNGCVEPEEACSVADFLDKIEGQSYLNVAFLVPHGNLRHDAMGLESRKAEPSELAAMVAALEKGLAEGAVGMSSGLDYIPSSYGDAREFEVLGRVLARHDLAYVSHIRGYGKKLPRGTTEFFAMGAQTGCRLHLSHLWGPKDLVSGALTGAELAGIDLTFDAYPYLRGSSLLGMVALPPGLQAGGPEKTVAALQDVTSRAPIESYISSRNLGLVTIGGISHPEFTDIIGLSVPAAAERRNQSVVDFLREALIAARMEVTVIMGRDDFLEEDLQLILRDRRHVASSDGIYVGQRPHPRGWGAFATLSQTYTSRSGTIDWVETVDHLSSRAARRFRLGDVGRLEVNAAADVAVISVGGVESQATYDSPTKLAKGVRHVLLSGEPVVVDGITQLKRVGRPLRPSGGP